MILMHLEDVPGDAQAPGFDRDRPWFRIEQFEFGVGQPRSAVERMGRSDEARAGLARECTLRKPTDAASFMLARRALSGTPCRAGEIKFIEQIYVDGRACHVVYFWFKLETVYVTNWTVECDATGRPWERFDVTYDRIGFAQWTTRDGQKFVKAGECNWDHAAGRPWKTSGSENFPKEVEIHEVA